MSNKTYDTLKRVALVWLPMVAAIIIGIGEIWNIPHFALIGATIAVIDTALGTALEKLSSDYKGE